jgi:hypothetical protein
MRIYLRYIFFLLIKSPTLLNAQNLVPNNSFENYVSCPNSPGQIDSVYCWTSFSITPDYFNVCAPFCTFGSNCLGYKNFAGYQLPYDGYGYVGISLRSYNYYNAHEIIGCRLLSPLIVGKTYYVAAFICRSNGITTHGASNNFGFQLYSSPYSSNNPSPINNLSKYHETLIVIDSINWTNIHGSFVADSAYEYLALGNFYDDNQTDTIDLFPSSTFNSCYYYVDNVFLSEDSILQQVEINTFTPNTNIKILSNVISDYLHVWTKNRIIYQLVLYDIRFKEVLNQSFINSISLNVDYFKSGLYYYQIISNTEIVSGKLLKIDN